MRHVTAYSKVLLLFFCSVLSLRADLHTIEFLTDIYLKGPREKLGSHIFSFQGDDFPLASAENPYFIKFSLPFNHIALTQSLVNPDSENATPIFLPLTLQLENPDDAVTLQAPKDAVSIVRWVAGENAIWIRIQASTSSWLSMNGAALPPSDSRPVSFLLGDSAQDSAEYSQAGPSNLPFPLRDPWALPYENSRAESLLLLADFTNSQNISAIGTDSYIRYDLHFYGADAQVAPGIYRDGQPHPLQLYTSGATARVNEWGATAQLTALRRAVPPQESALELDAAISFELADYRLGNLYPDSLELQRGSALQLSLDSDSAYGFPANAAAFAQNGQDVGILSADPESAFVLNGQTLFRAIRLSWNGDALPIENLTIPVRVLLVAASGLDPAEIRLSFQLTQANRSSWLGLPPFDLPHQARFGEPFSHPLASGIWKPFSDLDAAFIPHVTRIDGGFETQIALFHHLPEERQVRLQPYDASGQALQPLQVRVPPNQTVFYSVREAFAGQPVASLLIPEGHEVQAISIYRARLEGAIPAHSPAKTEQARRWRFFPGDNIQSWDGFAAVNRGAITTSLQVRQLQADSTLLGTLEFAGLDPDEKLLELISSSLPPMAQTYYELVAEQPITLIALRGNGNQLWENPAIALPEP